MKLYPRMTAFGLETDLSCDFTFKYAVLTAQTLSFLIYRRIKNCSSVTTFAEFVAVLSF